MDRFPQRRQSGGPTCITAAAALSACRTDNCRRHIRTSPSCCRHSLLRSSGDQPGGMVVGVDRHTRECNSPRLDGGKPPPTPSSRLPPNLSQLRVSRGAAATKW